MIHKCVNLKYEPTAGLFLPWGGLDPSGTTSWSASWLRTPRTSVDLVRPREGERERERAREGVYVRERAREQDTERERETERHHLLVRHVAPPRAPASTS